MDPKALLQALVYGVLPAIAAGLLLVGIGGRRLLSLALAVAVFVAFGLRKEWPQWPWAMFPRGAGMLGLAWTVAAAALVATL